MGVDAVVEDERRVSLGTVLDLENRFAIPLRLPGVEATACLRVIDPYGDTVFNQRRLPIFISELEALRGRVMDDVPRSLTVESLERAREMRWDAVVLQKHQADIESVSSQAVIDHIDNVLALARKSIGEAHTCPKCIGD